ncbi:GNAT family N-acetyltransferase [Burkholderia metallica]|uniref:GNAT family N-acetyltransferase n=1 Tax=Burkholderia metallica TaxID=488729 RepID=UPI0008419276|nr:GNAT family N-acetyltransferase [Burkholderia metallica]AOJ36101.1 hypothetical protein WJ16_32135 [Burkholderia metallica]
MKIRTLTPLDAARYQTLRLAALQTEASHFGASYEQERMYSKERIEQRLAISQDRCLFGAFDDDEHCPDGQRLIGMVALNRDDRKKFSHKGSLTAMYVTPTARGRGIGRALLTRAIETARTVPELLQLVLTVNAGNHKAIALYASLGFSVFGLEPSGIQVDGMFYDELWMYLRLRQ